jgi:hypothetical protein
MANLGQTVFDMVITADAIKGDDPVGFCAFTLGKLNAVVCQDRVNGVRNSGDQAAQEIFGHQARCLDMQFGVGKLRCPVNGDEKIEPTFTGLNLGNINMKVADGVGLECLFPELFSFNFRSAGDAMTLQTPMQGGSGETRNTGLQCVQTVIQRQQRQLAEGHNGGFLRSRKYRRTNFFWPHRYIVREGTTSPFGNRLGIDSVQDSELLQARFTLLD